jgi:hypothetical protein
MIGFSFRLPPATIPIIARHDEETIFFEPEGKRRRVFPVSWLWLTTVTELPDARAKMPLSPAFASTLHTIVPSGRIDRGRTFPISTTAEKREKSKTEKSANKKGYPSFHSK